MYYSTIGQLAYLVEIIVFNETAPREIYTGIDAQLQ